jgi:hypothetical protein
MQINHENWQLAEEEQKVLEALTQPLVASDGWRLLEPQVQRPGYNIEEVNIALEYERPRRTTIVLLFTREQLQEAAQAYRNRIIHPEILEIDQSRLIDELKVLYATDDVAFFGLEPLAKHLIASGCALETTCVDMGDIADVIFFRLGSLRISINILTGRYR